MSTGLAIERFAWDSEVDVVMLVMANPGFTLHEIDMGSQILSALCGEKFRQVWRIKDDKRNTSASFFGCNI